MSIQNTRSDRPENVHDGREASYWHMAQDIAFRAHSRLEVRDGSVYLVSDAADEQICIPSQPKHRWYETWLVLHERFPALSHLWPGYRPS
jgi:hypothetical protein